MIFQQFCHAQFDIVQDIFFQIRLEELSILVTFECIWIRTAMSKYYSIIIGSNVYPNKDGKKWRFRIRNVRSQRHKFTHKVDGSIFGSYNDVKLSACLALIILRDTSKIVHDQGGVYRSVGF
jgi:hypothetical protein